MLVITNNPNVTRVSLPKMNRVMPILIFETATRGDDTEGGHVPARQGQESNRDQAEDEGAHHQAP